jgi:tRNA-uridine 2-sulfurtransferase
MNTVPHTVVGLSGGVDSSVTAHLLKAQGHRVTGMFMKNWEDDDGLDEQGVAHCTTRQDWLDAASVADTLGIDIEAVNFAAQYKDRVFAYFLQEYAAGRTPNPDILCNTEIKFKAFLEHALTLGAAKMATGHYAGVRERVEPVGGRFELLRAQDETKDQSYFLHGLNQAQLSKALFPLYDVRKSEVRRIASAAGLHNHAKKDSTGICFIGERPFREFLNRYLPSQAGAIRNDAGKQVGSHMGLAFYTLGQRKGLGVGGSKDSTGEPWFVARKELASNTLYVVQGHDHPWLLSRTVTVMNMHWIAGEPPAGQALTQLSAKTRYRQADNACRIINMDTQRNVFAFDTPQWAATPGQSLVLYHGDVCLGGGVIEQAVE